MAEDAAMACGHHMLIMIDGKNEGLMKCERIETPERQSGAYPHLPRLAQRMGTIDLYTIWT